MSRGKVGGRKRVRGHRSESPYHDSGGWGGDVGHARGVAALASAVIAPDELTKLFDGEPV